MSDRVDPRVWRIAATYKRENPDEPSSGSTKSHILEAIEEERGAARHPAGPLAQASLDGEGAFVTVGGASDTTDSSSMSALESWHRMS